MGSSGELCFRTTLENIEKLEDIAEAQGLPVSDLVSEIVDKHLRQSDRYLGDTEKRRHMRYPAHLPAVIQIDYDESETHYKIGTILDISLSGVRVSIPLNENLGSRVKNQCPDFEIMFHMPNNTITIRCKCTPRRIVSADNYVHLGSEFVDNDFECSRALNWVM